MFREANGKFRKTKKPATKKQVIVCINCKKPLLEGHEAGDVCSFACDDEINRDTESALHRTERAASPNDNLANKCLADIESIKRDPLEASDWYVWMISPSGRKLLGRTRSMTWKSDEDGSNPRDVRIHVYHFNGEPWDLEEYPVPIEKLFII